MVFSTVARSAHLCQRDSHARVQFWHGRRAERTPRSVERHRQRRRLRLLGPGHRRVYCEELHAGDGFREGCVRQTCKPTRPAIEPRVPLLGMVARLTSRRESIWSSKQQMRCSLPVQIVILAKATELSRRLRDPRTLSETSWPLHRLRGEPRAQSESDRSLPDAESV